MKQKLHWGIIAMSLFQQPFKRYRQRRLLQQRIDSCQTVAQLRELVHSTQNKDEKMDRAFVRKLEQLDGRA